MKCAYMTSAYLCQNKCHFFGIVDAHERNSIIAFLRDSRVRIVFAALLHSPIDCQAIEQLWHWLWCCVCVLRLSFTFGCLCDAYCSVPRCRNCSLCSARIPFFHLFGYIVVAAAVRTSIVMCGYYTFVSVRLYRDRSIYVLDCLSNLTNFV